MESIPDNSALSADMLFPYGEPGPLHRSLPSFRAKTQLCPAAPDSGKYEPSHEALNSSIEAP